MVWISVAWIAYEMYFKVTDQYNEKWQYDWITSDFWCATIPPPPWFAVHGECQPSCSACHGTGIIPHKRADVFVSRCVGLHVLGQMADLIYISFV